MRYRGYEIRWTWGPMGYAVRCPRGFTRGVYDSIEDAVVAIRQYNSDNDTQPDVDPD